MTLAETIAFGILKKVGFIDPKKHPEWKSSCDLTQDHIDGAREAMTRMSKQDAHYEVKGQQVKKLIHQSFMNGIFLGIMIGLVAAAVAQYFLSK